MRIARDRFPSDTTHGLMVYPGLKPEYSLNVYVCTCCSSVCSLREQNRETETKRGRERERGRVRETETEKDRNRE